MGFTESIKLEAKKKANFRCCMCHAMIVDVHHIIPENDGGPDTIDNAATLCGACHRSYGNNPDLRKTIRQMRDHWNELCDRQNNALVPNEISISEKIDGMKDDLKEIKKTLSEYFMTKAHDVENANTLSDVSDISSSVSSGTISNTYIACPRCKRPMILLQFMEKNEYRCIYCDGPIV